jgi:hypothetical protein
MHIFLFSVLAETSFLPRYQYHRFLLDWACKGAQGLPEFPLKIFEDCTIIIGGDVTYENVCLLFGENTEFRKVLKELKQGIH